MAPAEEPGVIHKLGVQPAVAVWLAGSALRSSAFRRLALRDHKTPAVRLQDDEDAENGSENDTVDESFADDQSLFSP